MISLAELNTLLKPYRISLECDSCEDAPIMALPPKPRSRKAPQSAKKISKKSVKAVYRYNSERKPERRRKPSKKAVPAFNCIFDDDIMVSPKAECGSPLAYAARSAEFFSEFKQACDSYKNCPQFDNANNCYAVKARDFEQNTAFTSLELSEDGAGDNYAELTALKVDLFSHGIVRAAEPQAVFAADAGADFELDFGSHATFTEFFRFD